ncbi:GtrA family protein [Actinomyces sp. B33]|uniref:GtrA family protein n=1 Tax=Actinomyces sp. B33 TaxID=2942131 RepID=UPI002340BBFB|nr:GtrA family protein [Actinomyces sp. B33]MDC4232269.1 GtrA family protein [Actinomyces sp. B33]
MTTRPTNTLTALAAPVATQIRYLASSLSSTAVDQTLLLALNAAVGGLLAPVVVSRTASCAVNYLLNRRVFASHGPLLRTAARYAAWQTAIMLASYAVLSALTSAGVPVWIASALAGTSLFPVNYLGQRTLVFGRVQWAARVLDALPRPRAPRAPAVSA